MSKQTKGKETVENVQKKQPKQGAFKTVLGISMTCVNPFIALYILKQAPLYIDLVTPYIKNTIQIDNFEGKINFLVIFALYFSAFYAAMVILTIFFRVTLYKPNPVSQSDPIIIVACQRILTNSLEQLVIFLPNLAYFLFNSAQPNDKKVVITWAFLFIASRVLFSVGYLFGAAINFSMLRQTGFLIGTILSILLLVNNLGLYNTLPFIS